MGSYLHAKATSMKSAHHWVVGAVEFSMLAGLSLSVSCALLVLQLWLEARFKIGLGSFSVQRSLSMAPTIVGITWGAYRLVKPTRLLETAIESAASDSMVSEVKSDAYWSIKQKDFRYSTHDFVLQNNVAHDEVVVTPKGFIISEHVV
jgi:hypothetical protein